jgi:hypothetical protein
MQLYYNTIIRVTAQNNPQWDITMQKYVSDVLNVTTNQNYFKINGTYLQQEDGTLMGNPISSIFAEIFLQELERKFYQNYSVSLEMLVIY